MTFSDRIQALLAKHDGLSKSELTLAMLLARMEQIHNYQLQSLTEGKTVDEKEAILAKSERVYLDFLDVSLTIVENPREFPEFPGEDAGGPR